MTCNLQVFSRDVRFKQFCLAHLFTYQAFDGGVLGLAYIGSPRQYSVGGVCTQGESLVNVCSFNAPCHACRVMHLAIPVSSFVLLNFPKK